MGQGLNQQSTPTQTFQMPGLRIFGGVIGADIDIKAVRRRGEKSLHQFRLVMRQIAKNIHPFQGEIDGYGVGVDQFEVRSVQQRDG
jgi:hypothetical protein